MENRVITEVNFSDGRIIITLNDGSRYDRPLEAFPIIMDATQEQRNKYEIGKFGDDIRWECIDEDIHINSFYIEQEPEYNNEIASIFAEFPQLNISEVARNLGINRSLMAKYIYGIKKPSKARVQEIKTLLRDIGERLQAV